MRTVIFARYYLPPGPGRKSPYPSRFRMSPEEAKAHGALGIVPGSEDPRQVAETEEERRQALVDYQSAGRDGTGHK